MEGGESFMNYKKLKIFNCPKLEHILIGRFSLISVRSIEIESR